MSRFACDSCTRVYNEEKGDRSQDVLPDTPFDELPDDWLCPRCGASKDEFEEIDED